MVFQAVHMNLEIALCHIIPCMRIKYFKPHITIVWFHCVVPPEGEGGLKALNFRGVRGLHEQFTFQGVRNRFENVQIEKYLRAYSIAKTVETLTSRNNEWFLFIFFRYCFDFGYGRQRFWAACCRYWFDMDYKQTKWPTTKLSPVPSH